MQVKNYIEKVENSKAYSDWVKSNEDYYLVHVFRMSGQAPQVGYYSAEKDKVVTFILGEEINMNPPEDSFKESKAIAKLEREKISVDIDEALKEANNLKEKEYPGEIVDKDMVILQTLEEEPVYNITLITKSFNFINIKINANDKKIIHYQKNSILDLKE